MENKWGEKYMVRQKEEILEHIKSLADEQYRNFHSGLCPETSNILGVRVPVLRSYAKELMDEDWRETYRNVGNQYYEEVMLQGMMLGIAKITIEELLEYLEEFIPKIDNWAVCDVTCSGLKLVNKNREIVWEFLKKYLNSNKEFELRFAIVMLLDYYITDEYIENVIQILNSTKHTEFYYVKMAVAWALSVAYIKYPEQTMGYLQSENNRLDKDTYNKTLQKILESNRVGKREKNKIRKMRRKNNEYRILCR